jgi:NAD(P)-dependent dehydrogenase (short-subunit alcohol dehydrogenase family)
VVISFVVLCRGGRYIHRMKGKTLLLTGAPGGIGRCIALALAQQGAHIIAHARSADKAAPLVDEIKKAGGSAEAVGFELDSIKAVREAARALREKHAKLDVLINNAAIWNGTRQVSADGFEKTWAVNVLAPYILTEELLAPLKAARGRVVNLSSNEHYLGRINWDDLQFEKGYRARYAYRRSKLSLTMLTNELAARENGITANSLHPGVSGTGLFRNFPKFIQFWTWLLMRTPEGCAAPIIRLASASDVEGTTGKFFRRFNIRRPHRLARDMDACKRMRDIVAKHVG